MEPVISFVLYEFSNGHDVNIENHYHNSSADFSLNAFLPYKTDEHKKAHIFAF